MITIQCILSIHSGLVNRSEFQYLNIQENRVCKLSESEKSVIVTLSPTTIAPSHPLLPSFDGKPNREYVNEEKHQK